MADQTIYQPIHTDVLPRLDHGGERLNQDARRYIQSFMIFHRMRARKMISIKFLIYLP